MKHVIATTMTLPALIDSPAGTVAYLEVDTDPRAASHVQSQVQGYSRYHDVPLATRKVLIVDAVSRTVQNVVRVQVLDK